VRDTAIVLPVIVFIIWVWFLVTATTNGVNLTDGLDGLATGAAIMTFGAYTLMSVWQYGQSCYFEVTPRCYDVTDPFDLAVFAAAFGGALLGFLWYNTSPANIIMGDTGSLSIGGGIAALAILTKTQLLLPLLAGLFVIVTLSSILQVGSYKLRGKRIFKMAPLHHHFELVGWQEVTIVVRFWLIQALSVAFGIAIFYAEWVRQ
jgi:phospho-N-acetylmuramoyl-pentapeptide-transferase